MRTIFIRGLTKKFDSLNKEDQVSNTEWRAVYGVFERVKGGLLYSNWDEPEFDDFATDDIIFLRNYKLAQKD